MAGQERLPLRNIYLYLVCLITLVISIFAAVNLVRGVVELLYPDPGYYGYSEPAKEQGIDQAERERQEQAAKDSQRRQAVLNLVGAGTMLVIAGPVYVYHWRRVQSELGQRQPDPVAAGPPSP
jgi:hypothetical protein